VVTLANEALGPERLRALEAGERLRPRETVVFGATWFDNALRDAVSNVTVSATGAIVTQQRQNLGLTRIRGARVDLDWRPTPILRVSAGYMFNDSVVREFEANRELVGKRLPQVPAHRATAQITFADPRIAELVLTVLASGRQFDDDLNLRIVPGRSEPGLPGYATVDVLASRDVGAGITAFVGVQNLFDQQVIAGTLPTTVSAPRMLSIGIRWRPAW
jgi:outer membrane receptor for ferrienterochelin and colicins